MNDVKADRAKALDEIAHLAAAHDLTIDDIGAVLVGQSQKERNPGMIGRILGYVGAALIFGGLCLYIGMEWEIFSSAARVIITYGSGLAAFVLGILVIKDGRYKGANYALFTMAALLLPTGMFVFLKEYSHGGDAQLASIIVFAVLAIQFFAVFWSLRTTALLSYAYLFFNTALVVLMDYINVDEGFIACIMGLSSRSAGKSMPPPTVRLCRCGIFWVAVYCRVAASIYWKGPCWIYFSPLCRPV